MSVRFWFQVCFLSLLSVPAIILFIFCLWRMITISGMATAAASRGQRSVSFQAGAIPIARSRVRGKDREAAIEASEIYRDVKTIATHTAKANAAQIV